MAELPLRFIPIGAILGDYEAGESLAIPASASPGGSRNIWFDKNNRASSIFGHTKRNAAAVTSSVGANAMRLRHIWHHVIGTSRTELAIFESSTLNWELRKSTDRGATWTLIRDYGASYVGNIPTFAQMGTTVLLATGEATPQKIDVAAGTVADAGAAQTVAPTVVAAGNGLLNGTKRWKVLGILPGGVRLSASKPSLRTTFVAQKATVTWTAVAGVESYEIYSHAGTGSLFFFEGSVPSGTLTFTSNIADVDLVQNRLLQEHGDPPPNGARWATPHKQRMAYVGSAEFPRRVWLSDAGLPESVYVDSNFFEMGDANEQDFADEAVGATGGYLGQLIIWLEHSVWALGGPFTVSGAVINADRRRTSASVGAVHGRAVARVPAGACFFDESGKLQRTSEVTLAYLTPFGDVRLFDGEHDLIISHAKADTFAGLTYEFRRKSYCVVDTPRNELTFVFPADGATECSQAVTWNWLSGSMTDRPAWGTFAHATQIETVNDKSVLLAGESNLGVGGFCYQLWDGTTLGDGATAVNGAVMLKTLYGAANEQEDEAEIMSAVKRWRWVDFLIKCVVDGGPGGPVTFTVECWPEEAEPGDTPYATATVTTPVELLYTADGQPILSADGSQLAAPIAMPVLRAKLRQVSTTKARYLHSRGVRIRISTTTTVASWSICGLNVAYQLLEGLQRQYRRPFKFATIA